MEEIIENWLNDSDAELISDSDEEVNTYKYFYFGTFEQNKFILFINRKLMIQTKILIGMMVKIMKISVKRLKLNILKTKELKLKITFKMKLQH